MQERDPNKEILAKLKVLAHQLALAIVNDPDQVRIEAEEEGPLVILKLRVAPEDMGRIIGKKGRVANAMRILLRANAAKQGLQVRLEIIES